MDQPSLIGFSPRYLAYAAAHNETPEAMIARDRRAHPGGCMAGFIVWTSARWSEWRAETGYRGPIGAAEEERFDRWLARRARAYCVDSN